MYLTKFNQSECFKTSSHVNTNQVDSLFTKIADSPPISPEGSESPLQFQQSIMDLFEFPFQVNEVYYVARRILQHL